MNRLLVRIQIYESMLRDSFFWRPSTGEADPRSGEAEQRESAIKNWIFSGLSHDSAIKNWIIDNPRKFNVYMLNLFMTINCGMYELIVIEREEFTLGL